jgi:hypothetical protein
MTDKLANRKNSAAYRQRKTQAGYVFPKLCIHASILADVKALIQIQHKKLTLAQLTKELAGTSAPATQETQTA